MYKLVSISLYFLSLLLKPAAAAKDRQFDPATDRLKYTIPPANLHSPHSPLLQTLFSN